MKKLISLITIIALIFFTSCKSDLEKELDKIEDYIEEHNITVEPTESGLYYIETLEGTGLQASAGDSVTVHYRGTFIDGELFDSSYDRGEPYSFILGVGEVIQGWDEGISYMKEGGKAQLIIPSNLAYGPYGYWSIPGYTTLIFDVELIDVKQNQ
ncbi:MAG: FKBP-type peptidyl-prolyl cis-trans isomerase [Chlorobi bacterium]|nr:FKBP-type peptidyl-prolyl cis-trans isomerase [Chlorobiota bacterium]